jgi:hypothetical protein
MTPDTAETTVNERGRDLTLLALALVLLVEAAFLVTDVLAQGQQVLVRGAGRFALLAGISWMTWQGFTVSRWILVAMLALFVAAAPLAIGAALSAGGSTGMLVLTAAGAAGYLAAGLLLAGSRDVAAFLRQRRVLRGSDAL